MRRITLLLLLALARPTAAEPPRILSAVSGHLEAARYSPDDPDLHWTTWIGARADVLRLGGFAAYGLADLETIVGGTRRAFDAYQLNYHLETGLRRDLPHGSLALVFHHVSRHLSDREKADAVDWNLLGVRGEWRLREADSFPVRLGASLGRATLASLVGYRWEMVAGAEVRLAGGEARALLLSAQARHLAIDPDQALPREGFTDLRAELAGGFARGPHELRLYVAYERRNDVLLQEPSVRERALFGFRIAGRGPGAPVLPY